jgi:hypothetical protein
MIDVFLSVFIVLVVVGLAVWAVKSLVPMDPAFVKGINVLAVVFVVIYVLGAILSMLGYIHGFPVLIHR